MTAMGTSTARDGVARLLLRVRRADLRHLLAVVVAGARCGRGGRLGPGGRRHVWPGGRGWPGGAEVGGLAARLVAAAAAVAGAGALLGLCLRPARGAVPVGRRRPRRLRRPGAPRPAGSGDGLDRHVHPRVAARRRTAATGGVGRAPLGLRSATHSWSRRGNAGQGAGGHWSFEIEPELPWTARRSVATTRGQLLPAFPTPTGRD